MQKQKLHYALCANLKDSITHRVYKLQFIGLTRMNINEKINEIINVQNKARSAPKLKR